MAENEIEVVAPGRVPVPMPRTLDQQLALAKVLMAGGAVPAHLKTPEAVVMVMQSGAEIGMPPVASLRQHAIIQGKVTLSADGMVSAVMGTGKAEYFYPEEITAERATYVTKRKGAPKEVRLSFTIDQATAAGLVAKNTNYKSYPERMLSARAKSFLARDVYPDVLGGMLSSEEAIDITPEPEPKPPIDMPVRTTEPDPPQQGTEPDTANGHAEFLSEKERQELNKLANAHSVGYPQLRTWLKGQGVDEATKIPRELKDKAEAFIRGDKVDERLPGLDG